MFPLVSWDYEDIKYFYPLKGQSNTTWPGICIQAPLQPGSKGERNWTSLPDLFLKPSITFVYRETLDKWTCALLKLRHADTQLILVTCLEQLRMTGGASHTTQVIRFPRQYPAYPVSWRQRVDAMGCWYQEEALLWVTRTPRPLLPFSLQL